MSTQLKKGNSTWKPANVVDVINKEPGFRYRRIEKSPTNIAKKKEEGWEILSGLQADKTKAETGAGRINDGTSMTSVLEGYDYVIGRIPEELAQSRDEYMNEKTERTTRALFKQTKKDLGKDEAPTHGHIEMTKKGVRTIIKD